MPDHQALAAHLAAVPVTPPTFDVLPWLLALIVSWAKSVSQWVLLNADPRKLIDTPEERKSLEDQAIAGFDKLARPALAAKFGDMLTAGFLAGIEPMLHDMLDVVFVSLAVTLPPSPPAPPIPVPLPTGSQAP